MQCLEIWINDTKVGVVGHADAETLTTVVEATRGIGPVVVEVTAELPPRDGHVVYATWGSHVLSAGDELRIRIAPDAVPDAGTVVAHGIGEVDSPDSEWPLCSLYGKSFHDACAMVSGRRSYICDACIDELCALRKSEA